MKIEKKKSFYVAVLVNPNQNILEEIKEMPFDYYQLYDCEPNKIKSIKEKYKKKIITAITISDAEDLNKYKTQSIIHSFTAISFTIRVQL